MKIKIIAFIIFCINNICGMVPTPLNPAQQITTSTQPSLKPLDHSVFEETNNDEMIMGICNTLRAMRYKDWKTIQINNAHLLPFFSIPQINFSDFFNHCYINILCSNTAFLVAFILVVKFLKKTSWQMFNTATCYTIFLTALFLATNAIEDFVTKPSDIAPKAGLSSETIFTLWRIFALTIDYDFKGVTATTEHLLNTIDWKNNPVSQLFVFFNIPEVNTHTGTVNT